MPELPEPKIRPHPFKRGRVKAPQLLGPSPAVPAACTYAELHVTSNFSFLRGASHPEELIERAAALGHHAVAAVFETEHMTEFTEEQAGECRSARHDLTGSFLLPGSLKQRVQ